MTNSKITHLGIIMDGNRRWAKKHGLIPLLGHKKGYETFLKVSDWCLVRGIKILTVWGFSTENWKRTKKEVNYLMDLARYALKKDVIKIHKKGVKMQFLGRLDELPKDLQKLINDAKELTKDNTKGILNTALNYGGQAEIIDAINHLIKDKVSKITPDIFQKYLYVPKMPPPNLIIRTSGEQRTSGFLLWQSPYSELYFSKALWPDFSEKDLDEALADFQRRQRRFGK